MTPAPPPAPTAASRYRRHPRHKRRGVLVPVLGLCVLALLGLLVFSGLTATYGLIRVAISTSLVLLVFPLVVACFLWLDRWEPEPPLLLLLAFAWGAFFATLTAGIGNTAGAGAVCAADDAGCAAVYVAPWVEEFLKGLFLLGLVAFRRREIDGALDGIVYGGLVGAGFAFVEDVRYLADIYQHKGAEGLAVLFVLRGLLTPFTHSLFTMATGIGLAIAANSVRPAVRAAAPVGGFALAVLLHSGWNASTRLGAGFFVVYGLVGVPVFAAAVASVMFQRRRERRLVCAELPAMVQAGWIAPGEVPLLGSMAGRRRWRQDVRRADGPTAARTIAAYQGAIIELAVLRHRMGRGSLGPRAREWHDELVRDVGVARGEAIRHSGTLPAAWGRRPPRERAPPATMTRPFGRVLHTASNTQTDHREHSLQGIARRGVRRCWCGIDEGRKHLPLTARVAHPTPPRRTPAAPRRPPGARRSLWTRA